jgi:predicted enzyme related to lactoylglutathione lyase
MTGDSAWGEGSRQAVLGTVYIVTTPFLIELPADDPQRARRFWEKLLGTALERRRPDEGQGWQSVHSGVMVGVHERGSGPGDRFALPYFAVPDLPAALDQVLSLGARSSIRASAGRSAAIRKGHLLG